jgi:hypothetical protein
VEFEPNEPIQLEPLFSENQWKAKWLLCRQLSVPFYILVHQKSKDEVMIFNFSFQSGPTFSLMQTVTKPDFIRWWASIKKTVQGKPLNEAKKRIADSYFDIALSEGGLMWGGNIDGFLIDFDSNTFQAIIEFRITKYPLESYDPKDWFLYRGGDYPTWRPLCLLSQLLEVPLFLITLSNQQSAIASAGFSVIDSISRTDLNYRYKRPYETILVGIPEVKKQLLSSLRELPPKII